MTNRKPYIVEYKELEKRVKQNHAGIIAISNIFQPVTVLLSGTEELKAFVARLNTDELQQACKDLGPLVGPITACALVFEGIDHRLEEFEPITPDQCKENYENPIWHHVKAVAIENVQKH